MKRSSIIAALLALGCVAPMSASAQVVREDGVKSIAGVLFSELYLGHLGRVELQERRRRDPLRVARRGHLPQAMGGTRSRT